MNISFDVYYNWQLTRMSKINDTRSISSMFLLSHYVMTTHLTLDVFIYFHLIRIWSKNIIS